MRRAPAAARDGAPPPGRFAEGDLTTDAFLGGKLSLTQPKSGYRAATDPVLLAAAAHARPGAVVLDAGCGAGAALACLAARVSGLTLVGVEIQSAYAALARRNAPEATIWEGDLFKPPAGLRETSFDLVISNPPYHESSSLASPDAGRDQARREAHDAAAWAAACLRRVRSGGRLAIIQLAEKLPEILAGIGGSVGDVRVLPLQARAGRPAKRLIVTARKGAHGPFRITPPFVLHEGAAHLGDADDFTAEARAVLRDGAALAV